MYASTTTSTRDGLIRSMTFFRKVAELYRRSEEVHHLRLYRAEDIVQDLEACGFDVSAKRSYGRIQVPAGMAVVVAAVSR